MKAVRVPVAAANASLEDVAKAAAHCRNCPLWENATQTVFGEGPITADVMFVGEQPGDQEDKEGAPFVGPAGKLLDRACTDAGLERERIYVTNAVKHFKWKPRGKRRIHDKPNRQEIEACRPWLDAEFELVQPELVVVLGATAAQALLGSSFRVTKQRGQLLTEFPAVAPLVVATLHPSSVLRAPDDQRRDAYNGLVSDLKVVATALPAA